MIHVGKRDRKMPPRSYASRWLPIQRRTQEWYTFKLQDKKKLGKMSSLQRTSLNADSRGRRHFNACRANVLLQIHILQCHGVLWDLQRSKRYVHENVKTLPKKKDKVENKVEGKRWVYDLITYTTSPLTPVPSVCSHFTSYSWTIGYVFWAKYIVVITQKNHRR